MRAVLLILLAFAPLAASATADGPDFFRVEIEGGGAIVDLFETPGGAGALLASVPDGTDGLANRGCEGGLSYADWAQASEAERAEAAGQRWCRVVYGPFEGWVQGLYLREGNPPQDARAPSFDCAEARSSAEIAVCRSDQLARLDLEVARLYRLAQRGPSIGERGAELRAMQRGWIKGRDDCWKAGAGIADCIAFAQLSRIEALRSGYADARQEDAAGISLGPLPYTCEGF
ncbi:MAG: lysozyme inhibitor LprI family protein, partial [Pseudomonadota bacterium]